MAFTGLSTDGVVLYGIYDNDRSDGHNAKLTLRLFPA